MQNNGWENGSEMMAKRRSHAGRQTGTHSGSCCKVSTVCTFSMDVFFCSRTAFIPASSIQPYTIHTLLMFDFFPRVCLCVCARSCSWMENNKNSIHFGYEFSRCYPRLLYVLWYTDDFQMFAFPYDILNMEQLRIINTICVSFCFFVFDYFSYVIMCMCVLYVFVWMS